MLPTLTVNKDYYIPELDGLRALAIFLVIARHASLTLLRINDYEPLFAVHRYDVFTFFLNGWVGVDLFFVLSGYLISSQFFKKTPPTLSRYALKRILRIVPAYYTVLTLCVLGAFPFHTMPAENPLWQSYFFHLFFLQDYTGSDINSSFWSLGVEEKFYVMIPVIVIAMLYLNKKFGNTSVIIFLISMMAVGTILRTTLFSGNFSNLSQENARYLYHINYRYPAHCCLEAFTFGILIAFLKYKSIPSSRFYTHSKALFILGMITLSLQMIIHDMLSNITWFDLSFQPVLISISMSLIVLGAVFGGAPAFFKSPFMKWGSTMSYSLYLVHSPLIPLSVFTTVAFLGEGKATLPFSIVFLACFLTLTLFVATVIHWAVEKPALIIKDRI